MKIIYFLLFSKFKYLQVASLLIASLFFQVINLALIDSVYGSSDRVSKFSGRLNHSQSYREIYLLNWSKQQDTINSNNFQNKQNINLSRKSSVCMEKDLETLMTNLLRDLPGYANRVSQRSRRLSRTTQTYSYMLTAGKPEFSPLPTNFLGDGGSRSKKSQDKNVKQVFFTTLERKYFQKKPIHSQQFHRLFLTKTKDGWHMVMMFTQTASYPKSKPPTPPRDSSNSVVGQAIKTWLRDCRVVENRSRKS